MIRTKRFAMVTVLVLAMTLSVLCPCFAERVSAAATTFTEGNFLCTVFAESNNIIVDQAPGKNVSGALVIPATITHNGTVYTVTQVGSEDNVNGHYYGGFSNNTSITSISFASGSKVTRIGVGAFYQCTSVTSVTLPNTLLSIGECAFSWNAITSITIPASVTTLGPGCFQNCRELVTVNASGNSKITSIPAFAFDGCRSLCTFKFPTSVTSIGESAFATAGFYNYDPVTWVMPARLSSIGSNAFYNACPDYTLKFQSTTAPTVASNAFNGMNIIVPAGSTGYNSWSGVSTSTYSGGSTPTPQTPTTTKKPTATPVPTTRPSSATNTPVPTRRPSGATNTPVPTRRPSGATNTPVPTRRPSPTTAPSQGSGDQVRDFVERLYTGVLNRNGEAGGINYYTNLLKSGTVTGARVAKSFLDSPEFYNRRLNNEDFLKVLYTVFFGRSADRGGLNFYLRQLNGGRTRAQVISDFINSTEWANICLTYGIESGSNKKPTITVSPSDNVIDFARRLYTTCLGRAGESGGVNYWASRLANRQVSGTAAARNFFFSPEFTSLRVSNSEFIKRLYRTMYGREYDTAGLNYWLGRMANGMTREQVFANFGNSAEWIRICGEYGILK